ncbi:hypothetical protein Fmac_019387 [Flemingia macrophylla]|uniref:Uncharacterized protein n=1 Tax=Flemingia macrophylla TaxID=520843 RepID=A0ABD1M7P9_9FABA
MKDDEALAINCVNMLHWVAVIRDHLKRVIIALLRKLRPRIMMMVVDEADLVVSLEGFEFLRGFNECLKWFRVYFETLDESFLWTSNEANAITGGEEGNGESNNGHDSEEGGGGLNSRRGGRVSGVEGEGSAVDTEDVVGVEATGNREPHHLLLHHLVYAKECLALRFLLSLSLYQHWPQSQPHQQLHPSLPSQGGTPTPPPITIPFILSSSSVRISKQVIVCNLFDYFPLVMGVFMM